MAKVELRKCAETSADRFSDWLSQSLCVPEGQFVTSGLSELGVKIEVERAYSRAPITGVQLGWWRKDGEEYRLTYRERQRSKLGRMARLREQVETEAPVPILLGVIA
jgi:hypothetical protein